METNSSTASSSERAPAAPPPSPVRLLVLLGLLVLAIGAYAYDHFVAKPGCEAADKQIQAFVEEQNKKGVKDAALVRSADIQKELGRAPTTTVVHDDKGATVEYYSWWGNMPLLSRRRHFIAVVYVGQNPRHYSSHYREEPPAEAYPIADATPPALQKGDTLPPADGAEGGETKEKGEAKAEKSEEAPKSKDAEGAEKPKTEGAEKAKEAEGAEKPKA